MCFTTLNRYEFIKSVVNDNPGTVITLFLRYLEDKSKEHSNVNSAS